MTRITAPPRLRIVPANQASCRDLEAILARTDHPGCWCQRFKIRGTDWDRDLIPVPERARRLRQQTRCGHPEAEMTSGLVAYLDGEPAGWCAVEPRSAYVRLGRVPWAGRSENRADDTVWAVACFITRPGFRRRGISRALAVAAREFARRRGARALEGYPMITQPGREVTWGELHVGSRSSFAAADFTDVSHPTLRRFVMRIDF